MRYRSIALLCLLPMMATAVAPTPALAHPFGGPGYYGGRGGPGWGGDYHRHRGGFGVGLALGALGGAVVAGSLAPRVVTPYVPAPVYAPPPVYNTYPVYGAYTPTYGYAPPPMVITPPPPPMIGITNSYGTVMPW